MPFYTTKKKNAVLYWYGNVVSVFRRPCDNLNIDWLIFIKLHKFQTIRKVGIDFGGYGINRLRIRGTKKSLKQPFHSELLYNSNKA